MKKSEQQLADELDAFLTAKLRGQPTRLTDKALQKEAKAAADLLKLAASAEPDPAFVERLETHINRVSRRLNQIQKKAPEQKTFWQQIDTFVKENLIMNRTVIALGSLAAVAIIVVAAWYLWLGGPAGTPDVLPVAEVDVREEAVETAEPSAEVAELPLLPRLDASQSGGLGGGAESPMPEGAPLVQTDELSIMPIFTDVFSGTEFILETTLPTEPVQASVQQQSEFTITLDEARRIANAFGFSGPLYTHKPPVYVDETGVEMEAPLLPASYMAFDGKRTLNVDAMGIFYSNQTTPFEMRTRLPFAQLSAAAEAFLQSTGVLEFPYEIQQGWGNDVFFVRLVDGRAVNYPEISVGFNDTGEVVYASIQRLNNLQNLGDYPLRSAEEAWQLILDGVMVNNILYNYVPDFDQEFPVVEDVPFTDEYRYWQRQYQPGDEVFLYNWPSIFLPADGAGAPRIETHPFILQAEDDVLWAIANETQHMLHVRGRVNADGRTLQVESWESFTQPQDALFLQGAIRREGEQVLFTTEDGDTYIVPGAPADLPEDVKLNAFAWRSRDAGLEYPVLEWESFDVFIDYSAMEPQLLPGDAADEPVSSDVIIEEPGFYEPTVFEQVTINQIELAYFHAYVFPEYEEGRVTYESPTILLKPIWKFIGVTNTGEKIELMVDAVAPEFLRAP